MTARRRYGTGSRMHTAWSSRNFRDTLPAVIWLLCCVASTGCAGGARPQPLVAGAAGLPDCPASPNCVSSQASDAAHAVPPLRCSGDPGAALRTLRSIIEAMPRTRVVSADDTRLHAEVTSWLFRFVDDLDLLVDAPAGVVQVRSASRVGYSDLGVNRRRVETLRQAFEARQTAR